MSRIRDIANILSANTAMATDAEVSSAVSSAVSTHATAVSGHIGRGTTAQRPEPASIGDTYFDTTLSALISYTSTGWEKVSQDPAPQIGSISPTSAAVAGTTITITGSNFKSGLTVQFIGTNAVSYNSPVATFVSAIAATATTPALPVEYEPYDIKVTNNDNQFGILSDALDAGGTPIWNTASGTIATINEQTALNVSVSATDPDGTSVVYSSTNLPVATPTPVTFQVTNSGSGAYLMNGVSNGTITLTRGGTYTFNVNASGHPFYIQTTGYGYNASNVYSTGVTGAGAQVGTVTFTVPSNAPNTLYYQCQYHSGMYGQINIVSASSWVSLNSSTGQLTGTAPDISSNTTYSFDVSASDGVNVSTRSFSVQVNAITAPPSVEALVVAGGAAGTYGNYAGSGGGGGEVIYNSSLSVSSSTQYTVSVGNGGAQSTNQQNSGQDSIFSSIRANGGGDSPYNGTGTLINSIVFPYSSGNGYSYYAGVGGSTFSEYGGGGGGAGGNAPTNNGVGGVGVSSSITGSAVFYGGGGGGGAGTNYNQSFVVGGNGGGGYGASNSGPAAAGTANTGGGGGGGTQFRGSTSGANGAGGSGVVIIAYSDAFPALSNISGTLTYDQPTRSGYRVYRFTGGTGTVTF